MRRFSADLFSMQIVSSRKMASTGHMMISHCDQSHHHGHPKGTSVRNFVVGHHCFRHLDRLLKERCLLECLCWSSQSRRAALAEALSLQNLHLTSPCYVNTLVKWLLYLVGSLSTLSNLMSLKLRTVVLKWVYIESHDGAPQSLLG